jgi:fibronectin type 3 domain-containing protein
VVEQRGDGIEVSWKVDEDPDVVGYHLYRRDAHSRAFGGPVARPTRDSDSFFDRTVTVGETYIYSVTAIVSRQPLIESAITEVREVDYRDRFPPPVPGSLVALAEDGRVRVVWEDSDAPDLAGYVVSRRSGDGDWVRLTGEPQGGTEYVDTDVTAGVTYDYRVVAVDGAGNESDAAEASTEAR